MKNIELSKQILSELYRVGVREVAVCAGARNSPFVALVDQCQNLKIYSFFEERSAAFFMMGCARRLGQPTAIITTSGTAVAELLPAVIESFHSGVPLIVVSADRPRRLRGSGAPQSIDQTGLFKKFVSQEFDLENEPLHIQNWSEQTPLHVNVCFDEPLLDQPIEPWSIQALPAPELNEGGVTAQQLKTFRDFTANAKSPLVIVGTLSSRAEQTAVGIFLKSWQAPVFVEGTSGLRGLSPFEICGGEASLSWAFKHNLFDSVVRIGSVPTARIWRDLDDARSDKPVLSMTPLPFSGLGRGQMIQTDIAAFCVQAVNEGIRPLPSDERAQGWQRWQAVDRAASALLDTLVEQEPQSEPALMRKLSLLTSGDVYVGNSLPIREWDWMATRLQPQRVQANRGVNGIDGQLSTFFGLMADAKKKQGWCIVGDLTAMYDLSAPWARGFCETALLRIVVINNGGGKIFSRIFNNARFENRHTIEFGPWAAMWTLAYERWTHVPDELSSALLESSGVIEIIPDEAATARFHQRCDAFWSGQL